MEIWIQGTLFDGRGETRGRPASAGRRFESARSARAGWCPVTRDPAVAASHSEGTRIASDVRVGLARALDRLSPELRHSIREAVSARRSTVAA